MTTLTSPTAAGPAPVLRRLYLVRFGFAVVWALLLFTTADDLGPLAAVLLVVYPLFDVAAAVVDVRSSHDTGLYVNIAISVVATLGLAVASASGLPAVLRVWGVWAIVAGLLQLAVAISRRALGGQWPMVASGAISTLAGASFVAMASADDPTLAVVAGYATLGGVFFLASALSLGRGRPRWPAVADRDSGLRHGRRT